MMIRPIRPEELAAFARVNGRADYAETVQAYLERMLKIGTMRFEWCFVAEEAEQIIGTLGYWTIPSYDYPRDFVLLEIPWEGDDFLDIGTQLIRESYQLVRPSGAKEIGHVVDIPAVAPQWQYFPEQRVKLLRHLDFIVERETRRFEWLPSQELPTLEKRLVYRSLNEVGDAAYVNAIERVSQGTFDQYILHERDEYGPAEAARRYFVDSQETEYEPEWWQLAYRESGELVGLSMPSKIPGAGTIYYIGVVPEQRGHGYGNDLLVQGTRTLIEAGVTAIRADTDVSNIPMANTFLRIGYREFTRRQEYKASVVALLGTKGLI